MWVMDLNPDQALAAGYLDPRSKRARILGGLLRYSLRVARHVVVLDRFMKRRILEKGVEAERIEVIPPWSHNDNVDYDPEGREAFRKAHGLDGKLVVMYSGQPQSPAIHLDTLLEAAKKLSRDSRIAFCFVGGGSEFKKVQQFAEEHSLRNIVSLPYQPIEKLGASLSAADVHAVVMGNPFVGTIHPCKVYNVLAIGAPVLYIGPEESHVADLSLSDYGDTMCSARHGEVSKVVDYLTGRAGRALGDRVAVDAGGFAQSKLVPWMIHVLESVSRGVTPGWASAAEVSEMACSGALHASGVEGVDG